MIYRIVYTETAEQDLIDLYRYLENNIFSKPISINQVNNIVKVINTLSHFPYRCKLYNKKNWKGQDVHV